MTATEKERERDRFIAEIADDNDLEEHSDCAHGCCEALEAYIARARALEGKS